jgi:hypothetical protein
MRILVHHDGQQLGPYSLEQARAAVQAGSLNASDLAWIEGTPSWVALSSILDAPAGLPSSLGMANPQYAQPYGGLRMEAPTSSLATASLVLGVLSFVCLSFFGAIPAIICGHMARARIRDSHGREKGEGLALGGLICGYLNLTMVVVVIGAALLIPAFVGELGGTFDTRTRDDAREIVRACISHANDHDGKYPASLEELESSAGLDSDVLHRPGTEGFDYFGAGKTSRSIEQPSTKPLLAGKKVYRQGKRVIGYADGHVAMGELSERESLSPEAP